MSSLEDTIAEVLGKIENGENRFEPESASDAALREFQPTGQALEEAHERGYIEAGVRKSRCRDKWGLVLWVEVMGPVTFRGREFLEKREAPLKENNESPWVLEPNIYGLGVRLPQLWRRLKAKLKR